MLGASFYICILFNRQVIFHNVDIHTCIYDYGIYNNLPNKSLLTDILGFPVFPFTNNAAMDFVARYLFTVAG